MIGFDEMVDEGVADDGGGPAGAVEAGRRQGDVAVEVAAGLVTVHDEAGLFPGLLGEADGGAFFPVGGVFGELAVLVVPEVAVDGDVVVEQSAVDRGQLVAVEIDEAVGVAGAYVVGDADNCLAVVMAQSFVEADGLAGGRIEDAAGECAAVLKVDVVVEERAGRYGGGQHVHRAQHNLADVAGHGGEQAGQASAIDRFVGGRGRGLAQPRKPPRVGVVAAGEFVGVEVQQPVEGFAAGPLQRFSQAAGLEARHVDFIVSAGPVQHGDVRQFGGDPGGVVGAAVQEEVSPRDPQAAVVGEVFAEEALLVADDHGQGQPRSGNGFAGFAVHGCTITQGPGFEGWTRRVNPGGGGADGRNMAAMSRPFRRRMVSASAVLFLLCCGFEVVTGREHWPFSPYPMFSEVEEPREALRYRAWGDALDPAVGTVELARSAWIAPFHHVRLGSAIKHLARQERPEAALHRAARELLVRYEQRRRAGEHQGPALRSLRLVELRFALRLDERFGRPMEVKTLATADLQDAFGDGGGS